MTNTYKCDHCGYIYVGTTHCDADDCDAIICEGQEGCPRCDGPQATMICKYCGKQVCDCINIEKTFKEVCITPCSSGFGEYQVGEANGDRYASIGCLLAAVRDAQYGNDMCEEHDWHEDLNIRGRIHNEDQLVCMWYVHTGDQYNYYGIVEA